ncbi:MAG: phospholipase family protein, partial [Massilia sp.]|nr:phospholipase family protein [Massilia sp.]
PVRVKLDGEHVDQVSAVVHDLRLRLWKKIFGLMGAANPASALASVIDKPAAPGTWKAIQERAHANAIAYQNAFEFLPRINGKPSSIWPTWNASTNKLGSFMPFNETFWRAGNIQEQTTTWDAKTRAREAAPSDILGFIVALPMTWTAGENNFSGMNLTMLANNTIWSDDQSKFDRVAASQKGERFDA